MDDRDERAPDRFAEAGDLDVGEIDAEADADSMVDIPVSAPELDINTNDPDPTAGASDIGGVPGGSDDR